MNKILIYFIVLCLVTSLHVPYTQAADADVINEESLDALKEKLVNELNQAGIQEAAVNILSPMEAQTQNLENEVEEIYEEKFKGTIEKSFQEIINQDNQELHGDIEHLNEIEEKSYEFTKGDVQEFQELVYSVEETKEDIEYLEEIKEKLVFEHEGGEEELIDGNDIIVQIEGTNESNEEFLVGFGFEIGDNIINVFSETELGEYTKYEIKLTTLTEDSLEADVTNLNTGEEVSVDFNNEEFTTSAFWIPALGVVATASMLQLLAVSVGATTLIYLAAQGLLSLKAGALWVAGKVANDNTKNKRYVHYEAMRTSNSKGLWVGPGRSKSKAISRLKSGLDTWSIGSSNALSIAKGASPTGRYRFDSAHTAGKGKRTFAHYHPHEYGTHSFYGGGKLW
ncbi:hypothetical protein [Peribacillus frigoritolerans]|uniref:hypothetical protein n=1 Tax=Peribacillus frigoritolerans TaxID=450367 RepID=UPI0039A35438